jgi:hypothetical protein
MRLPVLGSLALMQVAPGGQACPSFAACPSGSKNRVGFAFAYRYRFSEGGSSIFAKAKSSWVMNRPYAGL